MFLTKLSLLIFYLRLFTTPNCRTKTFSIIRFLIVFYMLFYFTNLFIVIWPCVPRSRLWTPTAIGQCVNFRALFITSGTINTVADFILLILPITQIGRQKISRRRRIGVSVLFIIGLLYVKPLNLNIDRTQKLTEANRSACISSIMQLYTNVLSTSTPDKTYHLFPSTLWAYVSHTP